MIKIIVDGRELEIELNKGSNLVYLWDRKLGHDRRIMGMGKTLEKAIQDVKEHQIATEKWYAKEMEKIKKLGLKEEVDPKPTTFIDWVKHELLGLSKKKKVKK